MLTSALASLKEEPTLSSVLPKISELPQLPQLSALAQLPPLPELSLPVLPAMPLIPSGLLDTELISRLLSHVDPAAQPLLLMPAVAVAVSECLLFLMGEA